MQTKENEAKMRVIQSSNKNVAKGDNPYVTVIPSNE